MAREAESRGDASPIVWRGSADLERLLVPVDRLSEDPGNANTHSDLSIEDIAGSYRRFGQRKPIAADGNGVVRDGNGQLRAARHLGWTHIAVTRADGLDGVELALYSLATNQTARRSEFDYRVVQTTVRGAMDEGVSLYGLGWQEHELQNILAAEWSPPPVDDSTHAAGQAGSESGGRPEMGPPVLLTRDQRAVFDQAVARVRQMCPGVETSEGRALELICGDFLAGPGGDQGGGGS